jgi:hypothetical protein
MNNCSRSSLLVLLFAVLASSQILTTQSPNYYYDWNIDIVNNGNIMNPSFSQLSSTLNTQTNLWYRAKAYPNAYNMN